MPGNLQYTGSSKESWHDQAISSVRKNIETGIFQPYARRRQELGGQDSTAGCDNETGRDGCRK